MILKLPRVLQHRLKVHKLVWRIVPAELEEVFDDKTGKRESWLHAVKRDAAVNVEYWRRSNVVEVRMCKHDRLHLFRRDMHRESDVMVHHYAIVENEVFAADTYCECGPAYFLHDTRAESRASRLCPSRKPSALGRDSRRRAGYTFRGLSKRQDSLGQAGIFSP